MRRYEILTAIVACALLAFSGPALADAEEDAKQAFKTGVKHFNKGRFEEAAEAFEQAMVASPTWKLHYNIGQCNAALKRYGLALSEFELYIAEGGDDITTDRLDEVLAEIKRLRAMVGTVEIEGVPGDVVRVNGVNRGSLPLASRVPVKMGEVLLEVLRVGEVVMSEQFMISGEQTVQYKVETEDGAPGPEPTAAVEEEPEPERAPSETAGPQEEPEKKRLWTWVALGVGGAAAIGAGVLGGIVMGSAEDLKGACTGDQCADNKAEKDSLQTQATVTDVLWGVAGAAIVAGAVLFFVEPKMGDDESEEAPAVTAFAAPTSNGAALGVVGRF